jgi:transposase-like protein
MSNSADRVEVLVGIQRRRRYTAEQKMAFVQEASQPGMTISYVARRHGIAPSLIFGWRRRMSEGGKEAIRAGDEVAFQFMAKGAELTGTTTGPDGALIQIKNGEVDGARLRFRWISI